MAKKYVPEGVFLACDKGTSPSTLRVSNNVKTTIYSVPMATEADKLPFFNIKPMGICMLKGTCLPMVPLWENPKDGVKINGNRLLLEDSTCKCVVGGNIKIFFDRPSAVAFGMGSGKMPSEYIKDFFDWMNTENEANEREREKMLPPFLEGVADVGDWFRDASVGLVEGAVNGVVGLGETIYQVAQDPVGMAEAIGGMAEKGWNAAGEAYDWASKTENWEKTYNSTVDWASDGKNWVNAGKATVENVKKGAVWVAHNPRKLSNAVGEFVPDVVAAVYTAGGSVAVSAVKKGAKEIGEEVVEQAVKKSADDLLEAGAKKTTKEVLEQLAKKEGGDIAAVVTKSAEEIAEEMAEKAAKKVDDFIDDSIKPPPQKRPSWRQSEKDAAKKYPDYSEQKSFIDGKEVPYGTKGSTRPDLFKEGHSVEVKNYKIDNPAGKSRLKSELVRQYEDRVKHLPKGTKQTAIIDVRGQNISLKDLETLEGNIVKNAKDLEVIFMTK